LDWEDFPKISRNVTMKSNGPEDAVPIILSMSVFARGAG
jgi:hypothetical protein